MQRYTFFFNQQESASFFLLLILLDKDPITGDDNGVYAYPLKESGFDIWTDINPHTFTRKDWQSWTFSPFYKNVEHDKIVLI